MREFLIETARLDLRELTMSDLDDVSALLGDRQVMEFYPRPMTREESRDWIVWNRVMYRRFGHGLWRVILKATCEFVGECGLVVQPVDGEYLLEIGYHIHKSHQRRGYASEAAIACRDYAFEVLNVPKVISLILPENLPSQGVARKVGMTAWKETDFRGLRHIVFSVANPRSG